MSAPDAQLSRVAHLLELNRPEQALDELGRLPAGAATGTAAFRLRAAALTELDRWDDVVAVVRQGLAECGPDAELLGRLGLALRHRLEYAPAERALLDALAIAPQSPWLLCQYADLCCAVGQTDKAERLVARAAALAPDAPPVFSSRFQLAYARGDDRAAERIAREFLGAWPSHPVALALHGVAASRRGRVGTAHRAFGQALAHDPTDADYAEAAWESRVHAHPLLLPLRPLYRLGTFRTWLLAVGVVVVLNLAGLDLLAGLFGLCWLVVCVWSWVAPSVARRLVLGRWRS
ncbi:tetratricopeptide repeat protein [Micromonospora phytophila]|uniref:tetratricopeptide repeat protein n=1 Tax=Micromonospora phytophila TaxID=709888 RepID=UPI00202EE30D|nr:tetratricopeptide repeat protein [Micromonospora phytophila]MCM0676920.1 tetratricopeptide repeat protein [Micromonospora phytophila]